MLVMKMSYVSSSDNDFGVSDAESYECKSSISDW
jgi:hypothetical protein